MSWWISVVILSKAIVNRMRIYELTQISSDADVTESINIFRLMLLLLLLSMLLKALTCHCYSNRNRTWKRKQTKAVKWMRKSMERNETAMLPIHEFFFCCCKEFNQCFLLFLDSDSIAHKGKIYKSCLVLIANRTTNPIELNSWCYDPCLML